MMNLLDYEKINIRFYGQSNPSTQELIEVLRSVQSLVPNELKETVRINKIEEGSIDITALIEPILGLFMDNEFDLFWSTLGKIMTALEGINVPIKTYQWIQEKRGRGKISVSEMKEFIAMLNDDPNIIRVINQEDFKNMKKISHIIKKRKAPVVIERKKTKENIRITEDSTKIIELLANASGDEDLPIIEQRKLHLNIGSVHFYGKARWKARILEQEQNGFIHIKIEDPYLINLIRSNELFFSGQEVIEANVRIETSNGTSKYFLIEYINITTLKEIQYQ